MATDSTTPSLTSVDQFKDIVQEYVDLSDQIERAKQQIKAINERKIELEGVIREFMQHNHINVIDTAVGKIKLFNSQSKPGLKKETMSDLLTQKLGPVVASQVIHIVYDRDAVSKQKVKVIPKSH